MPEIHHLNPVPIRKAHRDLAGFSLQALLNALCEGTIKLYQLVPSGTCIDRSPKWKELITVEDLFKDGDLSEWEKKPSKVWEASDQLQYGPTALQISPESAQSLAKNALLTLIQESPEAALEEEDALGAPYIADDGSEVELATVCDPIFTKFAQLGVNNPIAVGPHALEPGKLYLETERIQTTLGDLVISREELNALISHPEKLAAAKSIGQPASMSSISHPAKDPTLDIYAPELHVALEVWEALYLRGEKPERMGHGRATWNYVQKHFPDMNIDENLVSSRIAPVSNTAKQKNPSNRGKTKS